jgi:uncharacterized repeat protein (TIGR01451 family)
VNCGWSGTVTPMKVGWVFTPPSRYYEFVDDDYSGENYVGTPSSTQFVISGTVTDSVGGAGMSGVTIAFFDGSTTMTSTTSAGGYYSHTVPVNWAGTVTPFYPDYTFSPPFAAVGPVQSDTTQDFVGTPISYCAASGDAVNDLGIVLVEANTGSQSSGITAYSDYTGGAFTSLSPGSTYAFTITYQSTKGEAKECIVATYIDYDGDYSFDEGCTLHCDTSFLIQPGQNTHTGVFTVPLNADAGDARMRVLVFYDESGTIRMPACVLGADGEVEDYTVHIEALPPPTTFSLGDTVWEDLDADGFQDDGEPGIAGVAVNLHECASTLADSTTTDASGVYSFTDLAPGDYYVQFVPPTGYAFTLQDQGGGDIVGSDADMLDSDADLATGQTVCNDFGAGEDHTFWDAGMFPLVEVDKAVTSPGVVNDEITFTVKITNTGPVTLATVSLFDQFAGPVEYVGGTPPADSSSAITLTWNDLTVSSGDIAPGQASTVETVFRLPSLSCRPTVVNTVVVTAVSSFGNIASDEATVVAFFNIYLPLVFRNHVVAPDLVVESVSATSDDVQVVIRNAGNGPVSDEFWVDVYIDPHPVPTAVNQIWPDLASQGLAWGVTMDLQPGDVLTLIVGDAYYVPEHSRVSWPLAAGTQVYAQVDSLDAETTYGAVLESHEITGGAYNNIGSTQVPGTSPVAGISFGFR